MNNFAKMFLKINNASFLPAGLVDFDKSLFHKINGQWHTKFLDTVLPLVREPTLWVPFYFFLIIFILINFKWRGWVWILFTLLLIMVSDFTSSSVIKEIFPRLRPCRDPEIAHSIRFIVKYCPSSSSFTSSHAVNHFAIATFIYMTFKNALSHKWALVFLWAMMISYAQVYVGVHFPVDVIAGAIFGIAIGFGISTLFNRYVKLPALQ